MLTGQIRNQVDQLWNIFWSRGISNPLSVIEQITYLLFAKRLDDLQLAKETQANATGKKIQDPNDEPASELLARIQQEHQAAEQLAKVAKKTVKKCKK